MTDFRPRAGVVELLRLFAGNAAAADRYAAACLERTRALEPSLRAFEYLPVDVTPRPGPLSGIPVAIKDIYAYPAEKVAKYPAAIYFPDTLDNDGRV